MSFCAIVDITIPEPSDSHLPNKGEAVVNGTACRHDQPMQIATAQVLPVLVLVANCDLQSRRINGLRLGR